MSELLVKLGKSGSEIREMLVQVYGDNAMKRKAIYPWVTHFSEGRESVTDKERSGRPAMSRTEEHIAKVCQTVCENHRMTARSIEEQVNIDREMVRKIITEGHEKGVCKNGAKGAHRRTKSKRSF
jgi:predicted HTH transcriptional regulator